LETVDVVASLAEVRRKQWMVAFALETTDPRLRAMQKLERKSCDLIVVNGPQAIHARDTSVEVLAADGQVVAMLSGSKLTVAKGILRTIQKRLAVRQER
jgi:phosphopantothenoylcysteine decarboxylase/phosphopantothenate--cysteine ligase